MMNKGIAISQMALIILTIIVITIVGVSLARYMGLFGGGELEVRCRAKAYQFCSEWEMKSPIFNADDRPFADEGGWNAYDCGERNCNPCIDWKTGLGQEYCKEVLGR